jgi:hypothetical protein
VSGLQILPTDVTVSPDTSGYTIRIATPDATEHLTVAFELPWHVAIQRAYLYARLRRARVLTSRNGGGFEVLDEEDAWLGDRRVWRMLDAATVQRHAPATSGVYMLRAGPPVYIGETGNLMARLLYHFEHQGPCMRRYGATEFSIQEFDSRDLGADRAARLIEWWTPPCNHPA